MRSTGVAGVALAIGLGIALAVMVPAAAQVKPPVDFTFDQGAGSLGPVTFSHTKHQAKVGKCTDCHTKVFQMKKGKTGPLTMAAMNEGKLCGACHNGKTAFSTQDGATCDRCHAQK